MKRERLTACGRAPAPILSGVMIGDTHKRFLDTQWDALIDTGADCSVVPLEACRELVLTPKDFGSPFGFDRAAPRRELPVYFVTIQIPRLSVRGLRVYAMERDNILLGRDFLKEMIFGMHAKKGVWTIGHPMVHRSLSLTLLSWI